MYKYYYLRFCLIVHYRFKKKMTLREIGHIFGISFQRIHQILGNTGYPPNFYTNREDIKCLL